MILGREGKSYIPILGKASHASRLLYRTTDNDGSEEIWSVLSQNGVGGKWHSLRLWLVEYGIHTENYYSIPRIQVDSQSVPRVCPESIGGQGSTN